jgi:hypothetical protein
MKKPRVAVTISHELEAFLTTVIEHTGLRRAEVIRKALEQGLREWIRRFTTELIGGDKREQKKENANSL